MATFLEDQSEKSDMIFNSKIVWILLHFPCYSVLLSISIIVVVTQKKVQ